MFYVIRNKKPHCTALHNAIKNLRGEIYGLENLKTTLYNVVYGIVSGVLESLLGKSEK